MSIYCTLADLTEKYGVNEITQASDKEGAGILTPNIDAVNSAIEEAGAVIDSYLMKRYVLPLVCTPSIINQISCKLARYFLHDNNASDRIENDKDSALTMLGKIRSKDVDLYDVNCGDVFTEIPSSYVSVSANEKIYTESKIGSFNFLGRLR